ncbi:hypothetical protein G7Y89_g5968 [Cudoniella acicularis]|uniref:Uncharacterized protein n=1 Tax=Cudoniella acicularis TaxID=354080 RepID=A0A8H4RN44_9HELO|nr:hypothetical protein G7Y89_g5968 [Cudoniella acicularis]
MIIKEIIKVAKSGVFTVAQLEAMLSTIPLSVQELYEDIFNRIKARCREDRKQSQYIVSWLLFARRALRVDEFRDIFAMLLWDKSKDTYDFLDRNRVGSPITSWAAVRLLLENKCGGLVEIVPGKRDPTRTIWGKESVQPEDQIQFIHQTVKELLLLNPDTSLFSINSSKGLRIIATTCINYLIMTLPLMQQPLNFSETLEKDWISDTFVNYIQDRPLLIYIFEHLPRLFESEESREEESTSVFGPLAHYLPNLKPEEVTSSSSCKLYIPQRCNTAPIYNPPLLK